MIQITTTEEQKLFNNGFSDKYKWKIIFFLTKQYIFLKTTLKNYGSQTQFITV